MRYALISDVHGNLPALEVVRVEYDVERAAAAIRESELPNDFAEYLLSGGKPGTAAAPPR